MHAVVAQHTDQRIGLINTSVQLLRMAVEHESCPNEGLSPDRDMCHAAEVVQKEGTKLASRQEFAKRVAMDLYRCVSHALLAGQGAALLAGHRMKQAM